MHRFLPGRNTPDRSSMKRSAALNHVNHPADAFVRTIMAGGYGDTNGAIVGGLVALSVGRGGIPIAWRHERKPLPLMPRV
jgi:hypothetical protein